MGKQSEIDKLTYSEAKKEIEDIVAYIESENPDVDMLILKVKRASELISYCKDKLTNTDKELQKILEDIG
ncbi:MAG: exodeoxyribonuclease VII small subunit [Fermentimonas sp.]|jgi:exodeoxyribonuclease VII small subunit